MRGGTGIVKIMVATSGGGHWIEMRRLLPAFEGFQMCYVGTDPGPDPRVAPARYHRVRNVSRGDPLGLLVLAWQAARVVRAERPDVVVSTGAAPGLAVLAAAKLLAGSRTIWVDLIASPERLSLAGRLARPVADAWLVQWPHLARPGGPEYWGTVL